MVLVDNINDIDDIMLMQLTIKMIHTHIIAHTGPTNAQIKPRSVDSQQL